MFARPWREAVTPRSGPGDDRASAEITSVRSELQTAGGGQSGPSIDAVVYFPTVAFTGPDGRTVEAESRCHDNEDDRPDEGERVDVFYSRADPQDVCVVDAIDGRRLGVVAGLGLVFGLMTTGLGVAVAVGLFLWSVHALTLGDGFMLWR